MYVCIWTQQNFTRVFCLHIYMYVHIMSWQHGYSWVNIMIHYTQHKLNDMQHSTGILHEKSEMKIQTNSSAKIHWNSSREAWNEMYRVLFTPLEILMFSVCHLSTTHVYSMHVQCLQCTLEILSGIFSSRAEYVLMYFNVTYVHPPTPHTHTHTHYHVIII